MQKNELFENVEVVDLTHEGMGVAKIDGFPIFVADALPTERIDLLVTKVGKSFGYGRVKRRLTEAANRVSGVNTTLLQTGIADLAHMDYPSQLAFKRQQIVTLLSKNAGLTDFPVAEVMAADEITGYRNKAQIPVQEVAGELETGFFRKHSHSLVPISDFVIQQPEIDEIINFSRDLFRRYQLTAYDEKTGKGLLRNLMVRRAVETGEIMMVIIATVDKIPDGILSALTEEFPALVSIQLNVNKSHGNAIFGKTFKTLFGKNFITDRLLGKTFQISAASFYQVNHAQAEKLYQVAYDLAELTADDVIVDAYSGIGTIGLSAADKVAEVYGMEIIPAAVENAKQNAVLNGIENAHYEVGTAEEVFSKWLRGDIQPDVIFVDPPRKGLDEAFILSAAASAPRSIIYISCNAATFSRDVARFAKEGYQLSKVQPIDLFPQTHHIELVGKFTRK